MVQFCLILFNIYTKAIIKSNQYYIHINFQGYFACGDSPLLPPPKFPNFPQI